MTNITDVKNTSDLKLDYVYAGDAAEVLKQFPAECIDLVVTSPPYGKARTGYKCDSDLETISIELARVLKSGGILCWNVADTTDKGSKTLDSHKQALFFKEQCGLRVHDVMFYEKNSSAYPASRNGKRYTNVIEYVYVFSKDAPKHVSLLCDKRNRWAGTSCFGQATQRRADGTLETCQRKPIPAFSPRNNVFYYYTGKGYTSQNPIAHEHPAVMPELMAFDLIRTFSSHGATVLDVMAGSGTSLCMAKALDRRYVGVEIDKDYRELIKRRLQFEYDVDALADESSRQYNSRFQKKEAA
jgi:site-specific DNA-methyltransferase (adenine-specific)